MRLVDDGHEETEAILRKIEKRIAQEFKQAEKEIQEKLDDYLRRFQIKDELKRRALAAGEITLAEYNQWRTGQIMMGKRWAEMRDTLASDFANASQIARSTAFGYLPEVYALNHNYGTFQVERGSMIDTSYTLFDRQTVERLMLDENGDFIPEPGRRLRQQIATGKAMEWNKKNVQSVMLQGILQGESIPQMATRLANSVGEQNRKVAVRNCRTLVTGVQNAGRVDSYDRARKMGIDVRKEWLATLDMRTRHWHRELDGQVVDNDKPFENSVGKIMFPGDPDADPANIYNCRCTLIASIKGFEDDASDLSLRRSDKLGSMSYQEWKDSHESYSDPILKQDQIADTMRRAYGAEYRRYSQLPSVENNVNMTTKALSTKIVNGSPDNPMDEDRYAKMKEGLKRNGITVMKAEGDDERYLVDALGAEASYGNGYIMHLGDVPSASAMFEEVIHSTQARLYGELDTSDPVELYAREVAANRKLLSHAKEYGFDDTDIEDVSRNLKVWESKFTERVGVSYDESDYKREV